MIISSAIVAKIFLIFINILHKPKEGVFLRNKSNKDYCYWSLRAVVRKWPTWLARQLSLPFLEILVLKMLGVRTSFSNSLYEGWIDCEFIELGKNVKIGTGSFIISNIIIKDKIILKKVSIKDNVIVGAHSIVLPGTLIESNTILDAIAMTTLNQRLESNSIYRGSPAKKIEGIESIKNDNKFQDIIFNSVYDFFNKQKKLKWFSISSSIVGTVIDTLLRVLTYPILMPREFTLAYLNVTFIMIPVIIFNAVFGGYVAFKIYKRIGKPEKNQI